MREHNFVSLLCAHCTPQRALMIVDDGAFVPSVGRSVTTSKLFSVVHMNGVVGCTGDVNLGYLVQRNLQGLTFAEGFRDFIGIAAGAIEESERIFAAQGQESWPSQVVALLGWSRADERFFGIFAYRPEPGARVVAGPVDETGLYSPHDPDEAPFGPGRPGGPADSPEKMIELARSQIQFLKRHSETRVAPAIAHQLASALGKRLLLAVCTRDCIAISTHAST